MAGQFGAEDPRSIHPQGPFPRQSQSYPGYESEMEPRPDFGEGTYKGSGKLSGKVALITGGDSGIGRAVALAFAREGADIVVSYLDEDSDAEETKRVVSESGRQCVLMPGDICDESHCAGLVQRTIETFGKLDVLVNNAAFQMSHPASGDISSEELDRTFRTNVYSMFFLCQRAIPTMRPGSTIINVASIQAYQPSPHILAYATTKGAIVTYSKGLSQELASKGIRVNVVAPGPVWTPLIVATMPKEKVENFGKKTPIGRAAQPAELAPAFVFLASSDSSYVTGEVIGVTGGELTA